MKRILFIISVFCISVQSIIAQIIISDDTTTCGNYSDTLQALSEELSAIQVDDTHDSIARPIGFSFDL